MRVLLFSLKNWLYDDSNLIKALLIMLAVLSILIFFFNVYYHKIVEKLIDRGRSRPYKRLRSDWEPKRPHDLTNSYDNPWDVMNGQAEEPKRRAGLNLGKIIFMIAVVVAIVVGVIIIAKRMGLF